MTEERLSEVREADAPPAIARIYGEIREATGLPLVNLLWRHMATLPGVLPWVWGLVGASYRSGQVARAAARLRNAASAVSLEPLAGDELASAGLDKHAQQMLSDLLEAYNRGNTQNLIGWSALLKHLRGSDGKLLERPIDEAVVQVPLPSLPPLPRLDDLDHTSAGIVERLSRRHERFPAGAVPSLYLHLAIWPGLLEPVDARLKVAFEAEEMVMVASKIGTIADTEADCLAPGLRSTVVPASAEARRAIEAKLETFTSGPIQEMILVGVALEKALEPE